MKYVGTLIAVIDMERNKRFYQDVLGLDVAADFGANVMLDGGISSWKGIESIMQHISLRRPYRLLTFREEPFFIGTFWISVVDSIGFHDCGSDNVEVPITDFIGTSR